MFIFISKCNDVLTILLSIGEKRLRRTTESAIRSQIGNNRGRGRFPHHKFLFPSLADPTYSNGFGYQVPY